MQLQLFLSYAAEDREIGEQIYLALLGAGHHVFFDRESLPRGGEYHARIRSAVQESDMLLFLISPDSVVEGSYALTELKYARNKWPHPEGKVIPVILRPTVSDKIPNYLKSVTWLVPEGSIAAEVVDAVAALEHNTSRSSGARLPLSSTELRNRRHLLAEVKREVTDRLRQSLHSALLMKMGKETKPQEVRRPWDVEVKITTQQSVLLAPDTEIIQVFDEETIAGELLILGAPGAGKTTTLLQLAQELVKRAETDTREPMPVLMNLTSWKDDSQTIAGSLVDGMHVKYGIRKDISQRWLDERSLLPLFDGLDELEPARQEKCVQAINEFQQALRPEHLVVCCRLAEYQNCQTKLELNGAVHLQPLADEQIHYYLSNGQSPELWNDIQHAPELLELARSPLLLSMMALVYKEEPIKRKHKLGPTPEGRKYLFDMYIERMLSRVSKDQQYPRDKTLHWLGWLAKKLHSHAQTEFLLERLQPSWLESLAQKLTYRTCVFLIVVMFVLVNAWLKDWMTDLVPEGQLLIAVKEWFAGKSEPAVGSWLMNSGAWSTVSLGMNFFVALIAGLVIGLTPTIKPIETLTWSGVRAWSGMVHGLKRGSIGGAKYGAYIGFIAALIMWAVWVLRHTELNTGIRLGVEFARWSNSGKIAAVIFGLIVGGASLWVARSSLWRIEELWDWQTVRSAEVLISGVIFGVALGIKMGLLVGGMSALGIALIAGLGRGQRGRTNFSLADGAIVGLIGWLIYGVLTWFIGRHFLTGFTIELFRWLGIWLVAWLSIAATSGFAAGLIAKLRAADKSVETLRAGIDAWRWLALRWRRFLLAGAGAGLVASLVMGLFMGLGLGQTVQAVAVFFGSLGLALTVMLVGPIMGGLLGAALGVFMLALPVALIGALGEGLTGPDIERRTMPNQGIRRAGGNIWRFALIGGLLLGSIWAVYNLIAGLLVTGLAPDTWDWLRLLLSGVLFWAPLAALVPGAACIQHFTLRFILWCRAVIPWHYARFLDYATERVFLQRVGGRYRFIHDLLRDHFAAIGPKQSGTV